MSDPHSAEAPTLNWTRTDSVALPQVAAERRFAIRMSDWERLKRQMERCNDDLGVNLSGWYFCSFGVAASAFLSIIPLGLSTGHPAWAIPLYTCVGIFAALLGVALVLVNWRITKDKKGRLTEIKVDMADIESGFQSA